jgi:hypothetical protein
VSVARGIVAAREADGDAAIGAVAARETRIAAWDALAADTRRLMLDAADSVAWECLASLPADAVSVSPEIWDAASDALRDAVRVRVASAPLPVWAVSDDGRRAWPDADADAGAAREHVRAVLSAGVEWRDTSGQTRGPNGNHLPIREAGRVPLSRLWGEYVSKARLALSREARRASAVSLDRTDDAGNLILRTPKAVIGVRQSSRATGTLTVPPGEVWELPTLALPVRVGAGVAWRVVERDSWDAAGVRVGALRLMTRADRTRLAEIILSRQDVEPARAGAPTRVERDAADDARRVIGAYRRACVWHEAGQTDTESLDAADGATPTARQARQARDAVTVTASAGYARTRQDRTARQARQAGQTRAVAFAYAVARRERLAGMRAASAVVAGLPLSVLAPLSR